MLLAENPKRVYARIKAFSARIKAISGGDKVLKRKRLYLSIQPLLSCFNFPALFRADCFYGTNIGACAAVSTQFRVNHINISFADRFNRALINTRATCSTII
jgi:hypothetical protein